MPQTEQQSIENEERQLSAKFSGTRRIYKNICDSTVENMDSRVNAALRSGWSLHGQPFSTPLDYSPVCQCVVKKKSK